MYFLIADYGTSSCRASLVDVAGGIAASYRKATSIAADGERAVVGIEEVWGNVLSVIRELVSANPDAEIAAVGVSSMLGWVLLDSTGSPIGDCITWMDRRCGYRMSEKLGSTPPDIYIRTGRRFSPELFISKWDWINENEPERASAASTVISLKDEIVRRLTGEIVSDVAHMNYTMCWDVGGNRADSGMLELAGIPAGMLPQVQYPFDAAGSLTAAAAGATGLREGTPVITGSIDGTTAMYGGGMTEEGRAVLVSGTTDVLMTLTAEYQPWFGCGTKGILTVNNGMIPGTFASGGSTGTSGGALMKVCSLLGGDCRELIETASGLKPGADGLLMTAGFSGERAPYWNPGISGSLAGLRMDHGPEHMIRAVMEGAAFRLRRLTDEIFSISGRPESLYTVGGGSLNDCWNMIKADTLRLPLTRPSETEATTIGTAMFCDCFMNPASDMKDLSRKWIRPDSEYSVNTERAVVYDRLFGIWENFIRNSSETFSALSTFRGL